MSEKKLALIIFLILIFSSLITILFAINEHIKIWETISEIDIKITNISFKKYNKEKIDAIIEFEIFNHKPYLGVSLKNFQGAVYFYLEDWIKVGIFDEMLGGIIYPNSSKKFSINIPLTGINMENVLEIIEKNQYKIYINSRLFIREPIEVGLFFDLYYPS
ncbi:MAG: hypothetical protein QXP60_08415 [Nitrososphaerota archaeon]